MAKIIATTDNILHPDPRDDRRRSSTTQSTALLAPDRFHLDSMFVDAPGGTHHSTFPERQFRHAIGKLIPGLF